MQHSDVPIFDRFIATGSYLTLGTIGMVWFILNAVVLRKAMGKFLMCSLIQSFVLSILYAIFSLAYGIIMDILMNLPFIGTFFTNIHIYLFQTPIYRTLSLINYLLMLFLCYLSVVTLFGKLPFVPVISDIAKRLYR